MPNDPFYKTNTWRILREMALERAKGQCQAPGCSARAVTVDHIIARRAGGADALANLRALCRQHDNGVMQGRDGKRRNGGIFKGVDASGVPLDAAHPWFSS